MLFVGRELGGNLTGWHVITQKVFMRVTIYFRSLFYVGLLLTLGGLFYVFEKRLGVRNQNKLKNLVKYSSDSLSFGPLITIDLFSQSSETQKYKVIFRQKNEFRPELSFLKLAIGC